MLTVTRLGMEQKADFMEIKRMTLSDVQGIYEIESECFSKPWSLDGIKTELNNDNANFFVAKEGDKVAGYIGSYIIIDECMIANVAVTKEFRKTGVASKLLEKLIEVCKTRDVKLMSLEVRKSNSSAIALYNKFLFNNVGTRKNFYQSPTEDAIIMTRNFKEEEVN